MKRLISGPWQGLRTLGLVAGALVFSSAAIVLTVGWGLDVLAVRKPLADFPTMKPNTALGMAALGLALALSRLGGPIRLFSTVFAVLATLIGVVTLAEYSFGWDARIDELLFVDAATPLSRFPGRPAPRPPYRFHPSAPGFVCTWVSPLGYVIDPRLVSSNESCAVRIRINPDARRYPKEVSQDLLNR